MPKKTASYYKLSALGIYAKLENGKKTTINIALQGSIEIHTSPISISQSRKFKAAHAKQIMDKKEWDNAFFKILHSVIESVGGYIEKFDGR